MKPTILTGMAIALCLISPSVVLAQFSSGSTGADGALVVTNDLTLDLPTNGVFNFTTITVSNGATLRFDRNTFNTPVYLLTTGDVIINGSIAVDGSNFGNPESSAGRAGPGGFDGGFGSVQGLPSGPGQGPGGGRLPSPWNGVYSVATLDPLSQTTNENIYGNTLLSPLIGGSGGAGRNTFGGGGGGGAILIAANTKVSVSGNIFARGGASYTGSTGGGGGSGGAIRVVAPIVEGTGALNTQGGQGPGGYRGGHGRTRIDALDRFSWLNLNLLNAGKWTVGTQMFVFPPGNPKLDIINAAGTSIPEGTNAPVIVNLPVGSSTNQIVRVQARGFTNDVPIRVKITPERAPSATFDGVIQQSSGNPPFADVQVTLPVDTVCHVHAWTR